ncbi:hypothetical protein [Mucilaginibacter gynuensis]|uniref:hypothetical protein n=1 Tax=Mucilaginibacter gynuensis TaxID=1302236 RepID=UPI0031E59B3D
MSTSILATHGVVLFCIVLIIVLYTYHGPKIADWYRQKQLKSQKRKLWKGRTL